MYNQQGVPCITQNNEGHFLQMSQQVYHQVITPLTMLARSYNVSGGVPADAMEPLPFNDDVVQSNDFALCINEVIQAL